MIPKRILFPSSRKMIESQRDNAAGKKTSPATNQLYAVKSKTMSELNSLTVENQQEGKYLSIRQLKLIAGGISMIKHLIRLKPRKLNP